MNGSKLGTITRIVSAMSFSCLFFCSSLNAFVLSAKFKDLVANEMEETAGRFTKKIMQKKKEAKGRPLWNEIKAKVDILVSCLYHVYVRIEIYA